MKTYIILIGTLLQLTVYAQKYSFKISLDDLKKCGYGGSNPADRRDVSNQVVLNNSEAYHLLQELNSKSFLKDKKGNNLLPAQVKSVVDKIDDVKTAIIFLQHPVDLEKLYNKRAVPNPPGSKSEQTQLSENYTKINSRMVKNKGFYNNLIDLKNNQLEIYEEAYQKKKAAFVKNLTDIKATAEKDVVTMLAAIGKERDELAKILITSDLLLNQINQEKKIIEEDSLQLENIKKLYRETFDDYIEDSKIEKFVLTSENKESKEVVSDYLLGKDNILIVLLGGSTDLQTLSVKIDNLPDAFTTSLNEMIELSSQVLGGNAIQGKAGLSNTLTAPTIEIPISFIVLEKQKIRFPSQIKLSSEKIKEDISFNINEKNYFLLKVGVSANFIDQKRLAVTNGLLTVMPDPSRKDEVKGSLLALIDICPQGRDLNKMSSILEKGTPILERISLLGGVKISKDPLETLFAGVGLSLSKSIGLVGGVAFVSQPRTTSSPVPISSNATLDYLRDNIGRKYEANFFFGLTFSPSSISKFLNK